MSVLVFYYQRQGYAEIHPLHGIDYCYALSDSFALWIKMVPICIPSFTKKYV